MKYFKLLILIFIFPIKLSHAIEFELAPSDQSGEVKYFLLQVKNDDEVKEIDVGLEGNANNVTIKKYYTFSCKWGEVSGVRLNMDSSSTDGPLSFDNIYVLDSKLNIVFAKSYGSASKKWIDPASLNSAICNRSSGGVRNDQLTKRDYIVDFEFIQQGPFPLKGTDNLSIKYIRGDSLDLILDGVDGEVVIDSIKNHDNLAPSVRTVFFMSINSVMNIISLVSWGGDMDEGSYYKVYGYTYDKNGNVHTNEAIDKDSNLSGYNTKKNLFKYKDASSIKKYILKNSK